MSKESIARRYSEALFGLAKKQGALARVTGELDAFVAALASDADVAAFYASPVVDRTVKQQIVQKTLAGRAGELTLNFIILLVRKRRETLVEMVARQMHELLDQDAGRQPAAVGTPTPLAPGDVAELARRLSRIYGRTIIPETKVSPELLGGLVVQVGDRYVDGSVARKLEELRRHLLASADTWATMSPDGKP